MDTDDHCTDDCNARHPGGAIDLECSCDCHRDAQGRLPRERK